MITWKDLEVFMSNMTDTQKEQRVVLIDYTTEFITNIDIVVTMQETVHLAPRGLYFESDLTSDLEFDSKEEWIDFINHVEDSVYKGEIALIIN